MSVAIELSRIQSNRNTIRAKLIELGLATSTDTLDVLADIIADLTDNGAVSITVREGETYTIPKGYHNGSGTVSGVSGGGNYNLQSKIATPTKKQQNITPDQGYYGLSDVTINPIPESYQDVSTVTVTEGDVLVGKIFVTSTGEVLVGTMLDNGAVNQKLDVTTISYTIPKGYHSGDGKVTIEIEDKIVDPTREVQEITPASGKVLSKVTINPIPDNLIDTTDADAIADNILESKTAYIKGVKITGSMTDNGDTTNTIDGVTQMSIIIPAGYTSGGVISLTDDIENALKAI